jgi:pyruvate,orthophosphate dikinase
MPGMMDTILNLGLNDTTVEGLKARTANGRFAFDSYRRFIQMFGSVVLEIPKASFEHEFEGSQGRRSAQSSTRIWTKPVCAKSSTRYKKVVASRRRRTFRRIPVSSCAARESRSSARGTTRARRSTGASTTSPTRSAPRSTCR